jgi:hypothetical protein
MPGQTEFASAALDGGDNLVGDVLMNVEALFPSWLSPPRPEG